MAVRKMLGSGLAKSFCCILILLGAGACNKSARPPAQTEPVHEFSLKTPWDHLCFTNNQFFACELPDPRSIYRIGRKEDVPRIPRWLHLVPAAAELGFEMQRIARQLGITEDYFFSSNAAPGIKNSIVEAFGLDWLQPEEIPGETQTFLALMVSGESRFRRPLTPNEAARLYRLTTQLWTTFDRAEEPLRAVLKRATSASDIAVKTGNRRASQAVLEQILAVARTNAFLSPLENFNGHHEGTYYVAGPTAGLALAYLKVRHDPQHNARDIQVIKDWFSALALRNQAFARQLLEEAQRDKTSPWNGIYTVLLALAAEAIACEDRTTLREATDMFRTSIASLQEDGTALMECRTKREACFFYHVAILNASVFIARLAEYNGEPARQELGLRRLTNRVAQELESPGYFERITGFPQTRKVEAHALGWLLHLEDDFPHLPAAALRARLLSEGKPLYNESLGGDVGSWWP